MLGRLRSLFHAGTTGARPDEAKYVLVTNIAVLATIPTVLVLGTLTWWCSTLPASLTVAVFGAAVVGYALVPLLNAAGRYDAARYLGLATATAIVAVPTLLTGTAARTQLFMGLTVIAVWLGLPPSRRGIGWAFSILNVGGAVALSLLFQRASPPYPILAARAPVLEMASIGSILALLLAFGVFTHFTMTRAEALLAREQERSDGLLRNVLPDPVIERLKAGETIADRFEAATVLFADIANFTPRAERVAPERLVAMLHEIFTRFDALCARHGLEKIKTIGDAYMVVGGVPTPRHDHVEAVAELALAMRAALATMPDADDLELRIGIHTGPVVAGVIGQRKFAYDLWGDTVNTASRMESHGQPGRIQTTAAVYAALRDLYAFEPRGAIPVKGKGELEAYFLIGRRSDGA
jgi:class 3 adenylate cyclase